MVACDLHRIYMLPAGGSCLLGSINLSAFVNDNGNLDFDALTEAVFDATVALNDVLDEGLPLHPLQEQRDSVRDWRQVGLGIMGLADMLIKMGIKYGSEDSISLCDYIARTILNTSLLASASMAVTKGAFPMYDYDKLRLSDFYDKNVNDDVKNAIAQYGLRNSQLLTIAPTGTLSTMLGISGGIEPIFANYYERKTESLYEEEKYFKVYTPIVKQFMVKHGVADDSNLPDFFVTAPDIKPIDRVKMQSTWQQYIDASISSTVNLPEEATIEDVADIYLNAYKHGLKGITVFRAGCRREGILTAKPNNEKKLAPEESTLSTVSETVLPRGFILDASDNLVGKKRKLMTGCGSLHVTAFFDPETGDLMETYLSKGSQGGCNNFMIGLSRMISLAARAGAGINSIIDQLNSSGVCPSYAVRTATKHDTSKGSCCPVAIGHALKDMWLEMQDEIDDDFEEEDSEHMSFKIDKITSFKAVDSNGNNVLSWTPTEVAIVKPSSLDVCPECGEPLTHQGGCDICTNCGWSKCN